MPPAPLAHGALDGDGVLVREVAQANRLHNKAQAGQPMPGNTLRLSRVEAAHCAGAGWLEVAGPHGPLTPLAILAGEGEASRRALNDFLVYRDLRGRGLVARHASGTSHFDVWPRGTGQGPPQFQTVAVSVDDPVRTSDLLDGARGDGIVCCVVDEDAGVTHYRLGFEEPKGNVPDAVVDGARGRLVADRVHVDGPAAVMALRAAHYGTADGDGLFLSLLEAEALRHRGALAVDEPIQKGPAPEVVQAYAALRAAGVVPKSGFRFGTHLRGYVAAPDDAHADWLVHCAKPGELLPWSALSRGVRLAHGVKKQFLVAIPDGDGVRFVRLAWTRV